MDELLLTQQAYDALKEELEERTTTKREEITKRIATARDEGDLKENGGYHAAREEQASNETKILELEAKLKIAKVVKATPKKDLNNSPIEPLSVITAKMPSGEQKFILGAHEIQSQTDINVFSVDSPIGQAILGAKTGDTVTYETPAGKEISVKILNVEPFK